MCRFFHYILLSVLCLSSSIGAQEAPEAGPIESEVASPEELPRREPLLEEFYREGQEAETRDFTRAFLRMLGILALMMVALLVLAWLSRRFLQTRVQSLNQGSLIQVIESRQISGKAAVHLVTIQGVGFAIGESPSGIVSLGKIPLNWEEQTEKKDTF